MIDQRKDFWDKKITGWEEDKYANTSGLRKVVDVNRSLKTRMLIAENVLRQMGKGMRVLELGCGSARLLPAVMESGVAHYTGVDISSVAIDNAKVLAKKIDSNNIATLIASDISQLPQQEVDFCFSLGFLDWIKEEEIAQMLQKIKCRYFLHSYSQRRVSLQQTLHKIYIFSLYGHRSKGYIPQYYEEQHVDKLFRENCGITPLHFTSKKLSFGTFAHNLPPSVRLLDE